jgi:integrase
MGKVPVQNIRRRDLRELLLEIAEASAKQPTGRGGRTAANDCLKYLKLVFDFAVDDLEWIETNPATGLRKLEVAQPRGREATNEELKALWNLWAGRMKDGRAPDWAGSAALQFLALTLQRGEEVASANWVEFDLEAKRWHLPAGRKKERQEAIVPLSEPALAILSEARRKFPEAEGPFPGRGNETIRRDSLTQLFSRDCETLGIEGLTMHDLRRTGRTAITDPERLGFPPHIGEAVLSHAIGNALTRTYDKNSYLPEKRRALEAWADEVLRVAGETLPRKADAKIVQLRQ